MKLSRQSIVIVILMLAIGGCAHKAPAVKTAASKSYTINGKEYYPMKQVMPGYCSEGTASWYGPGFHGRKTSCGETYDMHGITAAHKTLPMHTLVKVTNLKNNKQIVVRINDRGPFVGERQLDLSLGAAKKLDMDRLGLAPVRISVIGNSKSILAAKGVAPWTMTPATHAPNPFYREPGLGSKRSEKI